MHAKRLRTPLHTMRLTRPAKFTVASLAWLMLSVATIMLAINYSRDFPIYIDIIESQDSTDPIFDSVVALGQFLRLDSITTYSIFSCLLTGVLVYFLSSRKIHPYWAAIYFLHFYTLHIVTQVRAGLAIMLVTLALSASKRWVHYFTIMAPLAHASALLYALSGWGRSVITTFLSVAVPFALVLTLSAGSEKIAQYIVDVNETSAIPFGLIAYIVFLGLAVTSRLERQHKIWTLFFGTLTLVLYVMFVDFKAISNRIVEFSYAVMLLYAAAKDSVAYGRRHASYFSAAHKMLLLVTALGYFYVSNVKNAVLDF